MNENFNCYLMDPKKRVDFVTASSNNDLNLTKNKEPTVDFEWKQLRGAEVREFYETLLLEPSTSNENICRRKNLIFNIDFFIRSLILTFLKHIDSIYMINFNF